MKLPFFSSKLKQNQENAPSVASDPDFDKYNYNILGRLQLLIAAGLLFLFCYSLQFWEHLAHPGAVVRILGVAVLSALGFLLVGFLLGFIFCIPRTPAKLVANAASSSADAAGASQDRRADPPESKANLNEVPEVGDPVESNSNLNEISDWLTKIIVGVGLVQLNKIPGKLSDLSTYIGGGLRNCTSSGNDPCVKNSEALAFGIIIFFTTVGFLFGYIWTKFYYQRSLSEPYRRKIRTLTRKVSIGNDWAVAETLLQQNRLDEAMTAIDGVVKLNPNNAVALLTKGRILKRMALKSDTPNIELLKGALKYTSQAWALTPERGEPGYNLACYQTLLGLDKAEVLKTLKQVFSLDPRLKALAQQDKDFEKFWQDADFKQLTS